MGVSYKIYKKVINYLKKGIIIMQPEQSISLLNALVRQSLMGSGCTNGGIYFLNKKYEKQSFCLL